MNKTDEELMRDFQKGDDTAFSVLYNKYRIPIYRFLARKIGDYNRAEDMVQDVFVGIVKHANEWRAEASVKTYIYKIAFNKAISELRRSEHKVMVAEKKRDDDTTIPAHEAISLDSPIDNYEKQELTTLVRNALQQISPDFREVIILKEYEDLKYEEIAEILDLAIGTVKSRIFRGKMELKMLLEPALRKL